MEFNTLIEIIQKLFLFVLCFLLLKYGYGLIAVCFAYFVSGLFYLIANMTVATLLFVKPKYQMDFNFWKNILRESAPLVVIAAISLFYYNIDMIMIGRIKGTLAVSWYGVSYHLYYVIATLSGAFLTALFPVMSRFYIVHREDLSIIYTKAFKVLLVLGLPVSVGGFLLAEKIILFLYSAQYENSIAVFRIFSSLIILGFLNGLASRFLISINRQSIIAKALLFTASINVLLNFILIPPYSYIGAAAATVVSEILFFIISFASIPLGYRHFSPLLILIPVFSSIVMGAGILLLLGIKVNNLAVLIVSGIAIYILSVALSNYFDAEDKQILKNVFGVKNS